MYTVSYYGPAPFGDGVCVVLIGATLWAGYVSTTGPVSPPDISFPNPDPHPPYPPGPMPVPVPEPQTDSRTGTGEDPFTLPPIYQAPEPEPEQTPTPQIDIFPGPDPRSAPTSTCTPEPEKHISLGTQAEKEEGEYIPNLFAFTMQLNARLNPQAQVYMWDEWQRARLAVSNFPASFNEAAHNSKTRKIHFSLFGVKGDPNQFIEKWGGNGIFYSPGSLVTAVELYKIKNEGLCGKTKFYRRISPATGSSMGEIVARGTYVESMTDWIEICSGSSIQ